MPIQASPFQAIPRGIVPPVGLGLGLSPPVGSAPVPPPTTQGPSMDQGAPEQDLFQKVALMMIDPTTKQINPMIAMFFAGMGAREALEKSGKFVSKPHRSNEELAAMGVATPNAGQTNMSDPVQMAVQMRPPAVSVPPPPQGG